MVAIRSASPRDAPAVRAVHRAAFPTADEADLVDALQAVEGFDPALSLVAERDGEVVGHLALSPVTVLEDPGARALVLAPVGVRPADQGQGVGSALVDAGLERAGDRGYDLVVLHGDPAFYGRFGFEPAGTFGFENPFDTPPAEFQALRLSGREPAGGVLDYPAPFDAL